MSSSPIPNPSAPDPTSAPKPISSTPISGADLPVHNAAPVPVHLPDPKIHNAGVAIRCQFCVGQRFRRSRLRPADLKHLLLMRYPVRCLFCSQRQMVSFTVAGVSLPAHVKQPKRKKGSRKRLD